MSATDEQPIRITDAEARGSHVDDLLRRQANMRGDTGISADRRGQWYYRSWVTLGLAGAVAAFACWLLITPYFHDFAYIQGPLSIESYQPGATASSGDADTKAMLEREAQSPEYAIGGEHFILTPLTKDVATSHVIPLDALKSGQTVGVYLRRLEEGDHATPWVGHFVDLKPSGSWSKTVTLEQDEKRSGLVGLMLFALMAAFIGLFVGAVDGIVCRAYARALLGGLAGLAIGFVGGFILSLFAELIYTPLTHMAQSHTGANGGGLNTFGFVIQLMGRTLAWGLAGVAMGLGQGVVMRSQRLLLFGLLGGVIGGVLGGMLFDPIDLIFFGGDRPSAAVSRLVGFVVIGLSVGVTIGMVELLARDEWLRMEQGPLAGKEFLVFKDVMKIGSAPSSDIYLFNDPGVQAHHATLRTLGEHLEVESKDTVQRVLLNDRPVARARLRHGDRITLGRTVFTYCRKGA